VTGGASGDPHAVRKAPTLYDVAALAGVSHQTVSRLVKGQTNIRPEIRERVEAAIGALNYRPNRVARSLATNRSHRIGALFFDRFDEVGPTRSLQAASDRARDAGYLLDIVGLDPAAPGEIDRAISLVDQGDVAGIMVFAPTESVVSAIQLADFPVPVYVEFDTAHPVPAQQLTSNVAGTRPLVQQLTVNASGTRLLVQHLLDLGHRRFFTIAGPLDWYAAKARLVAYEEMVAENRVFSGGMIAGDWGSKSGYVAAMRMPLDQGITGIVVANDQMALGALKALDERGVRVPDDMSVVGFDDIPEAQFFKPSLTTIGLDFDRQGRMAMDHLLAMIDPRIAVLDKQPLAPELVVRQSSGPVAAR